jgi:DNA-binding response OmpR family regulator
MDGTVMNANADQPDAPDTKPTNGADSASARLNLLLSYGGWREGSAVDQLPQLLNPLGIHSIRVYSGEEAAEVISTTSIHIAVVDLAIPLHKPRETRVDDAPSGPRVLQLLRRLKQPPPTVVVRPPPSATRESVRTLSDALREGAFAVLDRPVNIETMLEVMRRVLRRHYADHWPHNA